MPSKHIVKEFVAGGIYHVYNRGVDKRNIFQDDMDYRMFLSLLRTYLVPEDEQPQKGSTLSTIRKGEFAGSIEILAFALMPNHYHLLIKQSNADDLSVFIKSLMTNYVMYFNKKYDRVGSLFQGVYKAILVTNDDYLVHLSRYIHLNPVKAQKGSTLREQLVGQYTSYVDYLGLQETRWLNKDYILDYFSESSAAKMSKIKSYEDFMEDSESSKSDGESLGRLAIDN